MKHTKTRLLSWCFVRDLLPRLGLLKIYEVMISEKSFEEKKSVKTWTFGSINDEDVSENSARFTRSKRKQIAAVLKQPHQPFRVEHFKGKDERDLVTYTSADTRIWWWRPRNSRCRACTWCTRLYPPVWSFRGGPHHRRDDPSFASSSLSGACNKKTTHDD